MNYGRFAGFRFLAVAFSRCNSQSETLVLGNKPIRLQESYRQCLFFLCATLKRNIFFDVNIVVKNKLKLRVKTMLNHIRFVKLNSVIAKYCVLLVGLQDLLFASVNLRLWQIMDLLATEE